MRTLPLHIQSAKDRGDIAFLSYCGKKSALVRKAKKAIDEVDKRATLEALYREKLLKGARLKMGEAHEFLCPID